MGCSPSKGQSNFADKNDSLPRSMSFPSYGDHDGTTSSQNLLATSKRDFSGNDMFRVGASMRQGFGAGHEGSSKQDQDAVFAWEEQSSLRRSANMNVLDCGGHKEVKKHVVLESAPSSPLRKVTHESGLPLWKKSLRSVKVRPDIVSNCVDNGSSSFRCVGSLDSNTGLRLLLSPVSTPSRSITASSRFGNFTKTLSAGGRFSHNMNEDMDFSRDLNSLSVHDRTSSPSEVEGMGDSEEPGSPLFDPSILATFEMAIEASSDDTWPCSEVSTSSRVMCSSSDFCSDADSSNWSEESVLPEACGAMCPENVDARRQMNAPTERFSHSKSVPFSGNRHTRKNQLENFECKFPPGSEDKIVLYFTSLRGIRKTYENCCLVRLILKGFGVHVDERDIWMHSKFKEELTNLMEGEAVSVPKLFIKGRYIGGAEDVKRLHEEGVLQTLLEGLPAEGNSMCDVCGGVRFVPCTTCSGSCKTILIHEVLRCPDCNENGLILCPSCGL